MKPKQTNSLDAKFWTDRPVLVTGATGLLGSWLTKKLIDLRSEAVCLVRDWVPQSELNLSGALDRVRVVRGVVQDQDLIERALGEYEIRTVFHVAAQTLVPVANRNPPSTFDTNIRGTWSVLEACRRSPLVCEVVVASSDKAYGEVEELPYSESTPLNPTFPYDTSKACAEMLARAYAKAFNMPVAVTRCGNFYGGGDLNWNRIVPGTIRSIIRGERPVIRSDGNFVRDYIYIEDAVHAYVFLAQKMRDVKLGDLAFNFSNGQPMAVRDICARILELMDSKLDPDIRNEASNEIRKQYLDSKRARVVLGWKPLFTLEQGLRKTIGWYTEYFGAK